MSDWRKVTDTDPPHSKDPVLTWDGQEIDMLVRTGHTIWQYAWMSPQSFNFQSAEYAQRITHWMPLPSPPDH